MMTILLENLDKVILEVAMALLPLMFLFLYFQLFFLQLPREKVINIFKGIILTFLGLTLFLQGVHIGFLPVGKEIGIILGSLPYRWILIPLGFILGFVATYAEPAVRILNYEVEKVSGGYISQTIMLYTLSIGVGISIALSMGRILFSIPLWYFIIPGYLIALLLTRYSTNTFISIAFDSGGVATGPMTVTFILTMAIGVASSVGKGDPMLDGFGVITLVALAPILSVLILGLLFARKEEENVRQSERQS